MKKVSSLLLLALLVQNIYSQHFVSKKWDARFGGIKTDQLAAICQTSSGNYLIGGQSVSPISGNKTQANWDTTLQSSDYWMVLISPNGQYIWDKRYGGTGDDAFTTICATKDGGFLLGGFSGSDSSGDKTQPSQGGYDYWVVKIDSAGNKQWDRRFGGAGDDVLYKVIQTKDRGYALAGFTTSPAGGDVTQPSWGGYDDYWVVKIDSAGNKQWDKRFGGTMNDNGQDIIQTPDGGYLVGGTSTSDSSGDKSQNNFGINGNFWAVMIDSAGNKQWDKVFGGAEGEVFGNSLNTTDGNYMLGGQSYDGISGNKTATICGYWLVKIDTAGNKLGDWAYGFGSGTGSGTCADIFGSMSSTADGGYLLTGISNNVLTIKIDSQMNQAWERTAITTGSFDKSAGALESTSGCYVIGVVTNAGIGGDKTQAAWDSSFDYWIVEYCDSFPLGIQEPEEAMHLFVYPNPTSGDLYINIQKDNLTEASFTLTNIAGQTIYQSTDDHLAHSYTKILDLSKLPTGVYMLDVIVDDECIMKKVLKE